ncbi:RDD family protein [Leptospira sp. GIMC2001]|uniref:RDD family protein n=1 Tax=Leptospira sp. GIMC2001 TaxID=1513297 RepID=UPI002349DDAD|nr:RDD family protein [Leptospira sp. GIMC2001]WCL50649.1 RDD family protein [Leptospira sp. GIMC2001]
MKLLLRKILGLLTVTLGFYILYIIPNLFKELNSFEENYFLLSTIPVILIATGFRIALFKKVTEDDYKIYGSLYRRFSAFLIDCIIYSGLFILIYYFLTNYYILLIALTMPITPFVTLFFLIKFEATPGKMLLGLKVLNDNFQKLSLKQAILRTIIDILFGIILTIGYLHAMYELNMNIFDVLNFDNYFDELKRNFSAVYKFFDSLNYFWLLSEFIVMNFNLKKKAIHDYLANSVVVNVDQFKK